MLAEKGNQAKKCRLVLLLFFFLYLGLRELPGDPLATACVFCEIGWEYGASGLGRSIGCNAVIAL